MKTFIFIPLLLALFFPSTNSLSTQSIVCGDTVNPHQPLVRHGNGVLQDYQVHPRAGQIAKCTDQGSCCTFYAKLVYRGGDEIPQNLLQSIQKSRFFSYSLMNNVPVYFYPDIGAVYTIAVTFQDFCQGPCCR